MRKTRKTVVYQNTGRVCHIGISYYFRQIEASNIYSKSCLLIEFFLISFLTPFYY